MNIYLWIFMGRPMFSFKFMDTDGLWYETGDAKHKVLMFNCQHLESSSTQKIKMSEWVETTNGCNCQLLVATSLTQLRAHRKAKQMGPTWAQTASAKYHWLVTFCWILLGWIEFPWGRRWIQLQTLLGPEAALWFWLGEKETEQLQQVATR